MTDFDDAFDPPLVIHAPPEQSVPFIFSVPHSGSHYPETFVAASRLDERGLRRSEDAFVDRMFKGMVALGAPVVCARFPRAYLDVNREPYELEPRLFDGPLPPYANTRSVRVQSGLGTIPRIVADGYEIYHSRLTVAEGLRRVETLYRPYHAVLKRLMDDTLARFGQAILVDCHSMPSRELVGGERSMRPDVVIGDRYGSSCAGELTDTLEHLFAQYGYQTVRNKPFAGGFITEFYGQPALKRHAIQIELNRCLYMDEELIEPLPDFAHIAGEMWTIFSQFVHVVDGRSGNNRIAAE